MIFGSLKRYILLNFSKILLRIKYLRFEFYFLANDD